MKRSILLFFTTACILLTSNLRAQSLFTYLTPGTSGFDTNELAMYDSLSLDTLYDSVMIVEIGDILDVQEDGYLDVNLPDQTLTADLFRYRAPNDDPDEEYTIEGWFYGEMLNEEEGEVVDYDGDITLFKKDNCYVGSIRPFYSDQVYGVISIAEGKHLLLKYNTAAMQSLGNCGEIDEVEEQTAKITGPCDKEIRVLVLYTDKTFKFTSRQDIVATSFVNMLNGAVYNSTYGNTQGLRFVLTGLRALPEILFTESNSIDYDIQYTIPYIPSVQQWRNDDEADLVICLTNSRDGNYADFGGYAQAIGISNGAAYATVQIHTVLNHYVLAHEIGHLMGARHQQSTVMNTTSLGGSPDDNGAYEHGYKIKKGALLWTQNYLSIMHENFNGRKDHVFSSPALIWRSKVYGTASGNDVVRTLYENACAVAEYRDGPAPEFTADILGPYFVQTGNTVNLTGIPNYGISNYDFHWWISTDGGVSYTAMTSNTNTTQGSLSFTMPNVPKVLVKMRAVDAVNEDWMEHKWIHNIYNDVCCPGSDNPPSFKPGQPTGITTGKLDETKINITPNPADSWVNIGTRISTADFAGAFRITVTDINGKKVAEREIYTPADIWSLDTGNMGSGIYFVTLKGAGVHITEKLAVVK